MSTVLTAQQEQSQAAPARDQEVALPFRSDTLLGVCEALGQDLGIHPNWLRIPFAALILWNPEIIIATYLGLGLVVAVTRWFFPARSRSKAANPKHATLAAAVVNEAETKAEEKELLAA